MRSSDFPSTASWQEQEQDRLRGQPHVLKGRDDSQQKANSDENDRGRDSEPAGQKAAYQHGDPHRDDEFQSQHRATFPVRRL